MNKINRLLTIASLVILGCCQSPSTKNIVVHPLANLRDSDSMLVEELMVRSKKNYENCYGFGLSGLFDDLLKEAEGFAQKNGNKCQLARIYNMVGVRYRNRSLFGEAMKYHQKALDLATSAGDNGLLATVYNQIGVVYRRVDDNNMAFEMHVKALKLAEQEKDSFTYSAALNSIGNVNFNLGCYNTSIEYFNQALDLSVEMNNKLGMAINYNNIGESLLKSNQVDSALVCFFISLGYNRDIDCRIGQAICFNSISGAYIAQGKPQEALAYSLQALDINLELGDRLQEAISYTKIGETYLRMNRLDNAREYLQKGFDLAMEIGVKFHVEESLRLLGLCFEKRGDYKKGLECFKTASVYRDSALSEKNMYHMATMRAVFDSECQRNRIEELNRETKQQRSLLMRQKWWLVWVLVAFGVLILAVVLGVRHYRLQSKYRNLGYQQRLLRTQMNPHFIFNALTAIQVYVMENDIEKSSRFLSDFAHLMRQVLRCSNHDYILLSEEKNTLLYYLELQQMRFIIPFEFSIYVDESLHPESVMVPPMITQPFVENAIEHGIRQLGGEGKVSISFRKSEDQMIVEVEDNGVGIEASKNAKGKRGGHESMAIRITRERLEVIRRDAGGKVDLKIIDKKKANPFDNGTLVRISFPLVEFKEQKKDD